MNEIQRIPVEQIRPFDGQPRHYFDEQALQELADSIKMYGQFTPAWVVEVGCAQDAGRYKQYELVAGERRWRACKLAGVTTLLCEVRTYSKDEQYVASVMENFGRKDCTTMETARSVGRLLKQYGGDGAKTAKLFARSEAWIRQMSLLTRLEPEVAAMLEPPNARLTTLVGCSLANLQPETQIRLAKQIAGRGLKHKAALAFVRNAVTNNERVHKQGRTRKPSDDFDILRRFLDTLGPQAQIIMGIGKDRFNVIFANRDPNSRKNVRAMIEKRITQLRQLEEMLQ